MYSIDKKEEEDESFSSWTMITQIKNYKWKNTWDLSWNGAETHERTINIAVVDWRETIQKTCVRMLIHPEGINV